MEPLPECPTFYPSAEEFADPLRYINNVIRPQAELQCGLAKVVPPPGWRPPFAIDRRRFRFGTRVQAVHELCDKALHAAAVRRFWEDYTGFLLRRGGKHKKAPTYGGQEIDLYALWRAVRRRGGAAAVSEDKAWRDVAAALQVGAAGAGGRAGGRLGLGAGRRGQGRPPGPEHSPHPSPALPSLSSAAGRQERQRGLLPAPALSAAAGALRGVLQDAGGGPL